MASFMYNQAVEDVLDTTLDLTSTLKIMLVGTANATYAPDRDHTVIDNGANDTTDPSFCELVATNYTGGFAGAGRKTATLAMSTDNANDRAVIAITDLTWTALGGASNDTVTAGILVKEITNDTLSRLVAYLDFTNTATNGSDFTLDFPAAGSGGSIRFTT
jgi:hypothetical protein